MKLSAPTTTVWWIAVIFGFLGIISRYINPIPEVSAYAFEFVVVGFLLLFFSTLLKKF
jgi:hypothetical protein